jgi:hypothetical protein
LSLRCTGVTRSYDFWRIDACSAYQVLIARQWPMFMGSHTESHQHGCRQVLVQCWREHSYLREYYGIALALHVQRKPTNAWSPAQASQRLQSGAQGLAHVGLIHNMPPIKY